MIKETTIIKAECEETIYEENDIKNVNLDKKDKELLEEIIYERNQTKTVPLVYMISNTTSELLDEYIDKSKLEEDAAVEMLLLKAINNI